jgi:hypothetical protein
MDIYLNGRFLESIGTNDMSVTALDGTSTINIVKNSSACKAAPPSQTAHPRSGMHNLFRLQVTFGPLCTAAFFSSPCTEHSDLYHTDEDDIYSIIRADRRLSETLLVYAAPDQDVRGVDM